MISKFQNLKTLDELPKLNLKWLVPNLIKEQTITQFFGAGGVGKTSLSLAIVKYALENKSIEQAIYIDCDNSIASLDDNDIIKFVSSNKDRFHYYANYEPKRFERDLLCQENIKGVLLIIDGTINFVDGGKLNSDESAIKFMQTLKELRAKGLSIIFQNHIAKHDNSSSKGNNQFENYSDENFKVERSGDTYILTPKKYRIPNIKPLEIKVDKSTFGIKNIYACDEIYKLDDKQKVTLHLSLIALEKSPDGLNKTELTSKINKLQNDMHYEIVGRNNLWKLLKDFSGKLFDIKKGSDPAKPNEKIYKILNTKEAKNLREKLETMAEF